METLKQLIYQKNTYNLVYSATALHWIRPEYRFAKPHALLKDNGYLAIIQTRHISDEQGDDFFWSTQPFYAKYRPDNPLPDDFKLPTLQDIKPAKFGKNLFSLKHHQAFPMSHTYTSKEYVNLLHIFSDVISMEDGTREEFLLEIVKLIDIKFGGKIIKYTAMNLTILEKAS